jgi:CPA2 family monovalent cation:H+ antiporter-2
MATSHGQLSLAVLVTQDLAAIGMIASVPILASWGQAVGSNAGAAAKAPMEIFQEASTMVLGIVILLLLARKLIPSLLREALRDQSGELPMLAGVAIALLTAYLSQKLGFSLEMGAFIAGFVLASSPFRFQLASRMSALRDLFMAIFFTTLGMELKLAVLADYWALILAGTLGLLAVKLAGISLASWLSGISARLSLRVGLALSQAGEFSLIILSQASDYNMFDEVTSSMILAVVVLSLILTPTILHLSPKLYTRFSSTQFAPWFKTPWQGEHKDETTNQASRQSQVIIAGYGPLGRHLAARLGQSGITYTVVELNPDTVREEQANNRPIVFGDISSDQMLANLDVRFASILALTFPDPQVSLVAASLARSAAPGLFIIARSPTGRDRRALIEAGADHVVVDENASAGEMFSQIATASLKADGSIDEQVFNDNYD